MSHNPLDNLDDEAAFLQQQPPKTKYYIAYLIANSIILVIFNGLTYIGFDPLYPLRWEWMLILHATALYLLVHYTAPFSSLTYTLTFGTAFGSIAFLLSIFSVIPLTLYVLGIRDVNAVKLGVSLMSCLFCVGFVRFMHKT